MSNVLELLSHNELIIRKNHLLKQLEKIDIQLEKIKKIENEITSNNETSSIITQNNETSSIITQNNETSSVIIKPIIEKKHISIKLKKDDKKVLSNYTETNIIEKNIKIKINIKKK
jgi:hypothetical protein